MKYILGSNVGELITIAATPLPGLVGVPLTPLQILWMDLVTDGLPALALALEPAEPGLMGRPPATPGESIFARGAGRYILHTGFVFGLITITMMLIAEANEAPWASLVFTTLCLAQMGHALSARSQLPLWEVDPTSNPALLGAVALTTLLQQLLLYGPALSRFFGTAALSLEDLALCFGFSFLLLVYLEAEKIIQQWRRRSSSDSSV